MLAPANDLALLAVFCVSLDMPIDDLDDITERHQEDPAAALDEILAYNAEHGLEPMPLP